MRMKFIGMMMKFMMRVEIEDEGHLSRFAKLGLSSTSFLLNAHTHRMFPAKYMVEYMVEYNFECPRKLIVSKLKVKVVLAKKYDLYT